MHKVNCHKYKPKLFHLIPNIFYEILSTKEKIKLIFRYICGFYLLYYLTDEKKVIGYCFLKHNWLGKYTFLNKGDWIINPYYVYKDYRGRGYAQKMIEYMLKDQSTNKTNDIYAIVKVDNIVSILVLEKNGFKKIGYVTEGFFHSITQNTTSLIVMKF